MLGYFLKLVWAEDKLLQVSHYIHRTQKSRLANFIGINASNKKEKYLGIPIASGRDIKAIAEEMIEKVKQRLQGWKMKSLSQAGRATLITSMASSIPSYQASSLILPPQTCSKLDALNQKFWWGSKEEIKHECCLKSWNSICTPKDVGGHGIKKTADMNKALVAKMTWDVAKGVNKMWVNIFEIETL